MGLKKDGRRFRKDILRIALFSLLGEECKECGTVQNLTFDLIEPALNDKHHRFNGYDRILFYWREHRNKSNVQVLCDSCNSRKGLNERYWSKQEAEELANSPL